MNKMITLKSRFTSAMSTRISALRKNMKNLTADQSGEGYLDMAMKILIIVVIGLDHEDGTLVSGPDIVSRGFVYVKENEDIMEGARATVRRILDAKLYTGISTSALKDVIREALSRYIYDTIKRNPMILTIIV